MSGNDESRLSAAKEINPQGLSGTSLGGSQPVSSEFNREAANDGQKGADQRPSEQVGNTAAAPRVKPPRELDRAGAAPAHKEQMTRDDLAAKLSPRQLAVFEAAQQRMQADRGSISPGQGLGR